MSPTDKTLYLIDGSSYIYRAYHAIRSLSNSQGLPTNAVFGFTRMLLKLIEDKSPEYVAILFDTKAPTFRHKMYHLYKANRPPMPEDMAAQIPYIKDVVAGFNLPAFEMSGYEADDLIGTLAHKAQKAGLVVVMVTGDKDFMQLVNERVSIWDPMKEKRIDSEFITTTMGINPIQLIDVMGLSGDTSDNIPGVPGIGPKTALALIQSYASMENLYAKVDQITKTKQRTNLKAHKEQAFLSKALVTIDTAAPLSFHPEDFRRKPPDAQALSKLFKALEFSQFQKMFSEKADTHPKDYRAVLDADDLDKLVSRLEKAALFAIDTETTSKNPMAAQIVGLSFAVKPHQAFYIPCGHDYPEAPQQLKHEEVLQRLKPVLENPKIKKVGQNIKYDWIVLKRHGANLNGVVFDTMLGSYLLNPTKRAHNLDQIALDFLDHQTITYKEVIGKSPKLAGFNQVPVERAVPYACEDADITLMAYDVLFKKLKPLDLNTLLETVEMPLVSVLMSMEMKGVLLDKNRLGRLSSSFEDQLKHIEKDIYALAGEEFNIKSPLQLGSILFEKLKLPTYKKTKKKTGYSTDVNVLTALAHRHELPALVLRHRTLAKLKSTYADALLDLIHPQTGRVHTSYNQTITATGRLSSSDPNLQNIPIRTEEGREIRRAFIPNDGWYMVSADYSQIELRILAHYADDPILIKSFLEDEDIHTRTACEVFQVFPAFITPELRRQAKIINFGIIYGMSAYGLSKELGISNKMAQTYIENYFSRYKGVKKFIDQTIRNAREQKKTSTLLGRHRLLPDIISPNKNIRQFAERTAVNTPIQGTAADLIKVAMIKIDAALKEAGLETSMLISVHDELVFEVPPQELDGVVQLVVGMMEGVWRLKVPLKVNIAWGKNWAEAH